jgi:uncharacterized protein YbaR (Trm112 family)
MYKPKCLGIYADEVNFAVCPYDDTHLKAQQRRPDPAGQLLLTCAACGRQFKLADSGPIEVPPDEGAPGT